MSLSQRSLLGADCCHFFEIGLAYIKKTNSVDTYCLLSLQPDRPNGFVIVWQCRKQKSARCSNMKFKNRRKTVATIYIDFRNIHFVNCWSITLLLWICRDHRQQDQGVSYHVQIIKATVDALYYRWLCLVVFFIYRRSTFSSWSSLLITRLLAR